jgi:hypothetical protein
MRCAAVMEGKVAYRSIMGRGILGVDKTESTCSNYGEKLIQNQPFDRDEIDGTGKVRRFDFNRILICSVYLIYRESELRLVAKISEPPSRSCRLILGAAE